jgi:hypothetical protein
MVRSAVSGVQVHYGSKVLAFTRMPCTLNETAVLYVLGYYIMVLEVCKTFCIWTDPGRVHNGGSQGDKGSRRG